jgi:hypothetical protein
MNKTQVFEIPVIMNNDNYRLLMYANDLVINNKINDPEIWWNGNFDNHNNADIYFNKNITGKQCTPKKYISIIPIPHYCKSKDIGIVDISTERMKQFRDCFTHNIYDHYIYSDRNETDRMSNVLGDVIIQKKNKLFREGKYEVEVYTDINELLYKVNDHFEADAQILYNKLTDPKVYPFNASYVLITSTKNIKNEGFGIVYPDPGFHYVPNIVVSNYENTNDIECFIIANKKYSLLPYKNKQNQYPILYHTPVKVTRAELSTIQSNCIMNTTKYNYFFVVDFNNCLFTNYTYLHYNNQNKNIISFV